MHRLTALSYKILTLLVFPIFLISQISENYDHNAQEKIGTYNFVSDESSLSSGIYFVQSNINSFEDVQKVVLVK